MSDEKPYWFPRSTDADWCARIRLDYPEDAGHLDDEEIRDTYADGWKYADTWDHLGDARHYYEKLSDAYLELLRRNKADKRATPPAHGDGEALPSDLEELLATLACGDLTPVEQMRLHDLALPHLTARPAPEADARDGVGGGAA